MPNNYTFQVVDQNDLVSAAVEADITRCAQYVISLISRYIDWQGTLDFVVNIRPGSELTFSDANGLLPSVGQLGWNGSAWVNQTLQECQTGIDADPTRPDAGCTIYLGDDGTIRNYGAPVWFDPAPAFDTPAAVPPGMDDFIGIFTHEIFHSLGMNVSTLQWTDRIVTSGPLSYFTGPIASALFGGPIPFLNGSDHYGDTGDPTIPITRGLMFEFGNYEANRLDIGRIDLAILADLGLNIKSYDGLPLFEFIDTATNLAGTDGADNLYGDYHANVLTAGGGNDLVEGGAGNDTLDGGTGIDTASYAGATSGVTVSLATATAQDTHGAGVDTLTGFENLTGSAFGDTLSGDGGANLIDGGGGADRMTGGLGDDIYIADNINDLAVETAGGGSDEVRTSAPVYFLSVNVEHLTGTAATGQQLNGNILDERIDGGAGNDRLNGRAGADVMAGHAGDDAYVVDNAGDIVVESPDQGSDTVETSLATYALTANVENLFGTAATAQTLTGNGLDNDVTGGSGADTLNGGAGSDTLTGNAGADILDGGAGADAMSGGTGNDVYYVDNAADSVSEFGGDGTDEVRSTAASYTLNAQFIETLRGVLDTGQTLIGAPAIIAGAGNDTLDGGQTMTGGLGDDSYYIRNGSGSVVEAPGGGTDTVYFFGFNASTYVLADNVERLVGPQDISKTLIGNGLANQITGGNVGDRLDGGAGADEMWGLSGDDTYVVDNVGDVVHENAGEGRDSVETSLAAYTLAANVEQLTGTSGGGQSLTGNALANNIGGGSGDDILIGGGGSDSLSGGDGFDTVSYAANAAAIQVTVEFPYFGSVVENSTDTDGFGQVEKIVGTAFADTFTNHDNTPMTFAGGGGNDLYISLGAADIVVEAANGGTDEVRTAAQSYTLSANVENLGGLATTGQTLTGNELDNVISADFGDDVIDGRAGADHMAGSRGNDIYYVDNAGDAVTEQSAEGTDEVRTSLASYTLAANVENLTGVSATGQALTGNGSANVINGGGGNDVIDGGVGADTMAGGAGNDIFNVDDGGDVVTENASGGTDGVRTTLASYTLGINVENLTGLSATGQMLTGNGLANVITGGVGNDVIDGGAEADAMTGGTGNDIYTVDNAGDVVTESAGGGTDGIRTTLASYTLGINVENLTGLSATGQTLNGNGSANAIAGGTGNDVIDGGAGTDTMAGGAGNDLYTVDNGGDVVTENASEGTDGVRTALASYTLGINVENLTGLSATGQTLTGNGSANAITGGGGNDAIDGGVGADTMTGGLGNDIYSVDNAGDTVTEAASGGTDEVRTTLAAYTLGINVEKLTGLSATGQALTGNGSANAITGGVGNDTLDGAAGADTMTGGLGNDVYSVDNAGDTVTEAAGAGTDEVRTTLVSYTLGVNLENLTGLSATGQTLTGNGSANVIAGGNGNDVIDGGAGADTMAGGLGNDIYSVDNAGDTVTEAASGGTDEVRTTLASYTLGTNLEKLTGLSATGQTLTGNGSANIITGAGGNDVIDGGVGTDTMAGGLGNDIYSVDNAGDVVTENAGAGTDEIRTALATYTLGTNLENLTGLASVGQTLTGNGLANVITGGIGNDIIDGGLGSDAMTGGLGNDVYSVDNAGDTVTEAAAGGSDEVHTTLASYVLGANIENLTGLSAIGQTLTGNGSANVITGGNGNDVIDGGVGTDTMAGGAGNDIYNVDNAGDVVTENAGGGTDEVRTALASYTLGANLENLKGLSSLGQTLTGNGSANAITGGVGDDVIDGGVGADTMTGGVGNDIYYVDDAGDIVTENAGGGTDRVRTTLASYTLGANVENLTGLASTGQALTGNDLHNDLIGGGGNDVIDGAGGADTMAGGTGNDIYYVDNGLDLVTENAGEGIDELRTALASYALGANVENLTGLSSTGQTLTGNGDANVITGNNGNDVINGGAGADQMTGGLGDDIYSVDNGGDTVTEAVGGGIDEVRTTLASYTLGANVENLTGLSNGGQTLTGNGLDNVIAGGSGNDSLDGGTGTDTLSYANAAGAVTVILAVTSAQDTLGAGIDTVAGFENLTGSTFADALTGDDGANRIDGGAGADHMTGGLGNDVYVVDNAGDVVTENAGEGTDTVVTALGSATDFTQLFYLPDNVENLTGTSATGQGVWASDVSNVIVTGDARDLIVLAGRSDIGATNTGDDNVSSGGGSDFIFFGAGFDASDRVDGGAGFDTIGLLGNYALTLDAHSLTGIEKFAVYGSGDAAHPNDYSITMADGNVTSGQQMLFVASSLQSGEHLTFNGSAETHGSFQVLGGHDTDTIVGSAGGDRFYGALGADTLTGGAGNDVFQYNAVQESDAAHTDLITDFTSGDKIDLWFVDANSLAGGDQAFSFIGSQAFGHHAGELRADNTSSNHWTIYGDVNGDGVADFQLNVTVADSHVIGANDFLL